MRCTGVSTSITPTWLGTISEILPVESIVCVHMDYDDFQKIETNQQYSEIYSVGNQDYYIFHNNKQNQAIWTRDSYECTISGNLSIEEMKQMKRKEKD